ncbi:hypothetical protein, partial [Mycolicibacterium fortuitum]|uniref:hypothetical protein n=1 Tax=Mycolicibacterium fortuitum TaxID=1766 RepID=UPI001A97C613
MPEPIAVPILFLSEPIVLPGSDQQFAGIAGLSGVDSRAGGVVEFDGHHHSRQDDRLAQEQNGHCNWFRHQTSKVQ